MSLEIGIIGLPNVGKSTLFNALTEAGAAVASYPFTTIEPNVGVVPVADDRLDRIAAIIGPEEVIPTTIRFVDIAGLVRGAHRGEGLGNQFLGHIRDVDAVAMVVRCFEAENVPHVAEELDPIDDIVTIDTELTLADMATVERRLEKQHAASKGHPRDFAQEIAWLERLLAHLDEGHLARSLIEGDEHADPHWASELNLITAKPRLYIANVSEEDLLEGSPLATKVAGHAEAGGDGVVVLCAQLEADLASWPPQEAQEYLAELGMDEPGLPRLIEAGYDLLDLITFFTTTGGRIVQAWTITRGTPAHEAAGRIHTDMQRGFIRAEVVGHPDLVAAGSIQSAKDTGHLRLEGRDYQVQDGDVVHFRFAV